MFENDQIALVPRDYSAHVACLDGSVSLIFDIIDKKTAKVAGEIALRIGDCPGMFYLGHIGYHVDPPYRGNHFARKACQLCRPVFEAFHFSSYVITTDADNIASIKTCEELGCVLECVVDVPACYVREFGISTRKRRYVYSLLSDKS
ncbi:MAG: GNAT family protein [Eubacteriales bacterium]|nr:GNAT family protein [Eubacteriales bacterium]